MPSDQHSTESQADTVSFAQGISHLKSKCWPWCKRHHSHPLDALHMCCPGALLGSPWVPKDGSKAPGATSPPQSLFHSTGKSSPPSPQSTEAQISHRRGAERASGTAVGNFIPITPSSSQGEMGKKQQQRPAEQVTKSPCCHPRATAAALP